LQALPCAIAGRCAAAMTCRNALSASARRSNSRDSDRGECNRCSASTRWQRTTWATPGRQVHRRTLCLILTERVREAARRSASTTECLRTSRSDRTNNSAVLASDVVLTVFPLVPVAPTQGEPGTRHLTPERVRSQLPRLDAIPRANGRGTAVSSNERSNAVTRDKTTPQFTRRSRRCLREPVFSPGRASR
jgi:hypothetical protein